MELQLVARLVTSWERLVPTAIEATATAHRLATHNSFLCAAKPLKWIILLQAVLITIISITLIL